MPATKIINVSKNDDFEEVFDLFKNTDAEEVIFIFPKSSRFIKQEQYFGAIKEEADLSGKKVSIMTTDPIINRFASKYDFGILGIKSLKRRGQETVPAPKVFEEQSEELPACTGDESFEPAFPETDFSEPAGGEAGEVIGEKEAGEEGPEVILTAAGIDGEPGETNQGRMIKDILPAGADRSLKIKEEKERPFEVGIKSRIEQLKDRGADIEKIWAEEEKRRRQPNFLVNINPVRKLKSARFLRRMPLLLTLGATLVLVLILYATLGSARIIVHPQKQKLDFKLKVSASSEVTAVNFDFNRIPGQRFREQREESGTFPATGQKDVVQKASGKITIFNKSFAAQRLVATTRFKSPEGLIFRIPQTITVPSAVKTGLEITAGSIESVVYADRPGAEYNIAPTRFTIPGFEGTSKFDDFYAVSNESMSGGIIGPAKVITEKDFAEAQETLTAKVKDGILHSLESQSGELKILDAVAVKLETPKTNAKVGDAAENLWMSIKGSADTIAFREADVIELVKNFVSKKNGLELLSKDLNIGYINPLAGVDNTLLSFDIQVNCWAAARLDKDTLQKDVAGMSGDAIRSYFRNIKEVESARVILSPFWVRNIPKDTEKIRIEIETN